LLDLFFGLENGGDKFSETSADIYRTTRRNIQNIDLFIVTAVRTQNPERYRFFFYLVCEAIGTAATPGLLCRPRVIVKMIVEKKMECRLTGETEVLGETCPSTTFCPSQNPT
jgi:hypothetical protein